MKLTDSDLDKQSILLTVDTHCDAISTVDLAVDMAVSLQRNLHALFIEDEALIEMANMPHTREISFPSGQSRTTTSSSMQRSLRAIGENFKLCLESTAHKSHIPWSYTYVQGNNRKIALGIKYNGTLTIVGQGQSLLPQNFRLRSSRKILVIGDHSPYLLGTLQVLMKRFVNEEVEIVMIKSEHSPDNHADKYKATMGAFENVTLTELDADRISNLAKEGHTFDYVIASKRDFSESFNSALKTLQCPLILFPA